MCIIGILCITTSKLAKCTRYLLQRKCVNLNDPKFLAEAVNKLDNEINSSDDDWYSDSDDENIVDEFRVSK